MSTVKNNQGIIGRIKLNGGKVAMSSVQDRATGEVLGRIKLNNNSQITRDEVVVGVSRKEEREEKRSERRFKENPYQDYMYQFRGRLNDAIKNDDISYLLDDPYERMQALLLVMRGVVYPEKQLRRDLEVAVGTDMGSAYILDFLRRYGKAIDSVLLTLFNGTINKEVTAKNLARLHSEFMTDHKKLFNFILRR
jgi:hypothetical protein